jgi:hypothetical protein
MPNGRMVSASTTFNQETEREHPLGAPSQHVQKTLSAQMIQGDGRGIGS